MDQYVFNCNNKTNCEAISKSIKLLYKDELPVIICIGSDLVVGDSLGPYVGSELNKRLNGKAYVYGTLQSPITAKEILTVKEHVSKIHPNSQTIIIDAAIGNEEELGYVKISNCGIKPGLGVNKDLPQIGDVSIIAILSSKIDKTNNFTTRFSLVYKTANDIINGVLSAF